MTPDPQPSADLDFTVQVERLYAALLRFTPSETTNEEPGLGGKLLYAGELSPASRVLLVAANIAGAASMAASADVATQKQAVRDGVADFLVNSLDEALRILKNEIRKRETVAVCIASPPQAVEREMLERGVLPDLLAPPFQPNSPASPSFGHAVPRPKILPALGSQVLVTWRVATAPAQWLPKLDAIAFDCLPTTPDHETRVARRWLRVAPRYLGRLAQSVRVLHCDLNIAKQIVERIQSAVDRGEFATEVHIALTR